MIDNFSNNITESADQQVDAISDALDIGDRVKAVNISDILWNNGGELSPEQKILYIECLLDMGEIERASSLLQPVMRNISAHINSYWPVLLKYAFLSSNLNLAVSISEYPDIYQQMEPMFKWLQNHQQDYTLRHFNHILYIAKEAVAGKMCAFDLLALEDDMVEFVFYSTDDDKQNQHTAAETIDKITSYLNGLEINLSEDWILAFDNIANRNLSDGSGN